MKRQIPFLCSFFCFQLISGEISTCHRETYLNLCDSIESNDTSTNSICNCNNIFYCTVVEFSSNCNMTTANLEVNLTNIELNEINCNLQPIDFDISGNVPVLEIINASDSNLEMSIAEDSIEGKFKLSCREVESVNKNEELEIIDISPKNAIIDTDVELLLSVSGLSNSNVTKVWCCMKSSDNETLILPVVWVRNSQILCSKFKPDVTGLIFVTVNCFKNSSNTATVKISGTHVTTERAEYSSDSQTITIYFNQNIELHSDCAYAFSKRTRDDFGVGFTCEVRGNALSVTLGLNFKKTDIVEIVAGNSIYRAGCRDLESSSAAKPSSLTVSEKKVLGPNLSLNSDCDSDPRHKHLSITAVPLENQSVDDSSKILKAKTIGKSHRENLMVWRIIRHLQTRLSSSLIDVHINSTDVHPSLEHLASLESFMENERNLNISWESNVSVVVTSPPAPSVIFAEAKVTFCRNITFFVYKWSVNDEVVQEGGKVLIVKDLPPGKYIITCTIVEYNTSKVLGQGWTTAEVTESYHKATVYPSEVEIGPDENILLHAQTWYKKSVSWTCRTDVGKFCYTLDNQLIDEVVDLKNYVLSVPSGTLPVGSYFWSVSNGEDSTTAKVTIKTRNIPSVSYDNPTTINSSQRVLVNGVVKDLELGCRVWYTSVREKGFDYLDLQKLKLNEEVEISTELLEDIVVPLILPSEAVESKTLQPGSSYMFRLQALCPDSGYFSQMKVPVLVNDPPRLSPLVVEPLWGEAMITEFTVSGAEANDSMEDYPLLFQWSIVYPCENYIQIERGVSPKHFTTFLPPGDIVIIVEVCDVKKACSVYESSTITVIQPKEIPTENFQEMFRKIKFSMASGETMKAFTLSEIVLRSIALTPEGEIRENVSVILEDGITATISDLTKKLRSDGQHLKEAFDFVNKAFGVARFLPKDSDIFQILSEFRHLLFKTPFSRRVKRNSIFNGNEIKSLFKLHSSVIEKNDTLENRMELLKDVRKYLLQVCSESLLNSFLIVSPIVNISITKVEFTEQANRSVEYHINKSLSIEIIGKVFKQKTCIGIAQFSRDLLGNTNESRLTPVYDVQVVSDGKFIKPFKNDSVFLKLIFRMRNPAKTGVDCMTWTKSRGWTVKCELRELNKNEIVCVCRDFGYFSAFLRFPIAKESSTSKNSRGNYWNSCVAFAIRGQYEQIVGKNPKMFLDNLKRQIVQQMKIPSKTLSRLIVKPGSILVTVFFIDINETKAEAVVKDLVRRMYTKELELSDGNNSRLEVDVTTMEILTSPGKTFDSSSIHYVTYSLLAGSLFVILAAGIGIAVAKKKSRTLIAREVSVDKQPMYRHFYNERSLNGDVSTLGSCRNSMSFE